MAETSWRYAEPDGKQRALSLEELQHALAAGRLPTNVPVWCADFDDWRKASELDELKPHVEAGAGLPFDRSAKLPGEPVAHRGGAAATSAEPPSPPTYVPARGARPQLAADEDGDGDGDGDDLDATQPFRAATLGAALRAGQDRVPLDKLDLDEAADTREMPAAQRASLRVEAGAIKGSKPALPKKPATTPPPVPPRQTPPPPKAAQKSAPPPMRARQSSHPPPLPAMRPRQSSHPPPLPTKATKGSTPPPPPMVDHSSSSQPPAPKFPRPSRLPDLTPAAPEVQASSAPPAPVAASLPPAEAASTPPAAVRASEPAPAESKRGPSVPLWGAIAAVVAVGAGALLLAGAFGGPQAPAAPQDAPVASNAASSAAAPAPDAATTLGRSERACKLSSSARPIASGAIQDAGVSVTTFGTRIGVGFATDSRASKVLELDPSSLVATEQLSGRSDGALYRVQADLSGEKLAIRAEYTGMSKGVSDQHRSAGVTLGIADSKLVRVADGGAHETLFALPAVAIDALRVSALGTAGDAAYVYRAPGSIWLGTTLRGDSPQRMPGLNQEVGTPTVVALDAEHVLAAWPDHPRDDDPWGLQLVAYAPGKGAVTPSAFRPAGREASMLGPHLLRVDADRALLLWTEQKRGQDGLLYDVVAQTLGKRGEPIGEPIAVSAADMSGGQPHGVMSTDGKAIVAFLLARGDRFDVAAAALDCN